MHSNNPNSFIKEDSLLNTPSSLLNLPKNIYIDEKESYACTKCKSNIEIISIDHNELKIIFKCLNKNENNNHHIQTMSINEYLSNMENNIYMHDKCSICYKEQSSIKNFFLLKYCVNCDKVICNECKERHFNNNESQHFLINNNERRIKCLKHPSNNNVEFCLKCKSHLCKECKIEHVEHETKSLGNIIPTNKEKEIFQKNIDSLKNKSEQLEKKKNIIKIESTNKLNEVKKQIQNEWEEKSKLEEIKENKELEDIENKKKEELEKLKKIYEEKINEITKKYNLQENKIKSKYLEVKESIKKLHNEKIVKIVNELSNNNKYIEINKKLDNLNNLILIYEIIKKTQEKYSENYYNNINFINAISFFDKNKINLSENKLLDEKVANKFKELKLKNNSQSFNNIKSDINSNPNNHSPINEKIQSENNRLVYELEKFRNKYKKLEKENKNLQEKKSSNTKLNEFKKSQSNISIFSNNSISSTKSITSNKSINSNKNSINNMNWKSPKKSLKEKNNIESSIKKSKDSNNSSVKNFDFKSPKKIIKERNIDYRSPSKQFTKILDSKRVDKNFTKNIDCRSPKKLIEKNIDYRSPKKSIEKNIDCRNPKKSIEKNIDCRSPKKSIEKNIDCRSPKKFIEKNIDCRSPKKSIEKNIDSKSPKKMLSEKYSSSKEKNIFDSYSATDIDDGFIVFKSAINENPYIIYSDKKKSICTYNLKDNKFEHVQNNAHAESISNFRYFFNTKSKTEYILSLSYRNNQIKIWNFKNWEEIIKLIKINKKGFLYSACFLKNKNKLYFLTSNYVENNQLPEYIKVFNFEGEQINYIKESDKNVLYMDSYFDKNKNTNYIIASNKDIKSYDYNKKNLYKTYQEKINPSNIFSFIIYRDNDNILKILESSYNGIIRLWNFHSGDLFYKFKVESNCIGICLYNKEYILVGCGDKTLKLIKLKDGIINKIFSGHESKVCSIKKIDIQHEKCFFSLGKDNKIRKWKNILVNN